MAPCKKNKTIDEGESSAAASKRRRLEILNGTNGVPFTNPITEFPSTHLLQQIRNPPRRTTVIGADLQLSPPAAIPQRQNEETAADDDRFSSLVTQQNLVISFHTNQMRLSMEEFWRRSFAEEVKKRKEVESRLKQTAELVDRFRQMYHFYEERTFLLEDMLLRRVAGEGCCPSAPSAPEEEVQSSFVDPNSIPSKDIACRNCRSRPATMVWLPCRHLCLCLICERRVRVCPICSVPKTDSFMINLPFL